MTNASPTPPPPREGQRHSPEPWRYQEELLREMGRPDLTRFSIYGVGGPYRHPATCHDEANAARIVACVNACAGFSSPATDVPRLVEAARAAEKLIRFYGILLANYRTHSRPGEKTLDEVNKAGAVTDALRAALPPEV